MHNIITTFNNLPSVFHLILMPLVIFFARIIDVSIGTVRIILVARGKRYIAPILGFFEILVWITAMGQIMQNLSNIFCYIAYAAGFAAGTYIGMIIEEKLALGYISVRIIANDNDCKIARELSRSGFGVTTIDAQGAYGNVKVIYTLVNRKYLDEVLSVIKNIDSNIFYSIEDERSVNHGIFPKLDANNKECSIIKKLLKFMGFSKARSKITN